MALWFPVRKIISYPHLVCNVFFLAALVQQDPAPEHPYMVEKRMGIWYNDSADAEFKPADAVLPSRCDALYRIPWLAHQMSPWEPLDGLRTWYNRVEFK